jgi:hypothetical protein
MKALHWVVVFSVLFYAGWLTVPYLEYATGANALPQMSHVAAPGGIEPDPTDPIRGGIWLAAIVFYILSAILFAGNARSAPALFVVGLLFNMSLFMLDRTTTSDHGLMPCLVPLGVIGLLMIALGRGQPTAWS